MCHLANPQPPEYSSPATHIGPSSALASKGWLPAPDHTNWSPSPHPAMTDPAGPGCCEPRSSWVEPFGPLRVWPSARHSPSPRFATDSPPHRRCCQPEWTSRCQDGCIGQNTSLQQPSRPQWLRGSNCVTDLFKIWLTLGHPGCMEPTYCSPPADYHDPNGILRCHLPN